MPRKKVILEPIPEPEPPKPKRSWAIYSTFLQWSVVVGVIAGLWYSHNHWQIPKLRAAIPLPGYQTEFYALCMAFTFVNGRYWATKPMSCLKCMTAWISLALGCYEYGWGGMVFLPIGFMVGAIVDRLTMRL